MHLHAAKRHLPVSKDNKKLTLAVVQIHMTTNFHRKMFCQSETNN